MWRQEDKQSKATSSLFPIKKGHKETYNKTYNITESHNGSNIKQQVNNNRTTALERTAAWATVGLNCI